MKERALAGSLADELRRPHEGVSLAWLGQAGFLLRIDASVLLIDPYLSDSLAEKYRGHRFEHRREMAAPIAPDALPRVDLVLCTHRHGDHMDGGTLPVIARAHPGCRFVVPAAEAAHARDMLPAAILVEADAGEALSIDGIAITPVPAAHERLETDGAGRHRFLGYGIEALGARLYHSGDCVPFAGLPERVAALGATVALLPVNGRDRERAEAGIPGNFSLPEAIALCRDVAIPILLPHHWGMFSFNDCDPAAIASAARLTDLPRVVLPSLHRIYRVA